MSLQRPPKPDLSLEGVQQLSVEQQILLQLQSLSQEVAEVRDQVGTIRASNDKLEPALQRISFTLFGSADEETPHGRLPRVESDVSKLERRVRLLEDSLHESEAVKRLMSGALGVLGGGASSWLIGLWRK